MRLHRLEVEAFGPFAHRQVIDLQALGDAGLFLIAGPTGAGKTSLLDAVSFALFTRVPGSRSHKQLKSQHADDSAVPRVLLEVTLAGRRFRVERTAAFERPGRKTPVQASVVLDEQIDGAWRTVARRLDEAGRILEDVLGMNADQFHRVVVLPQGDFAAFLHASNDERELLLRRLFDVSTYSDIEDWLLQERRRLEDASRDLGARLTSARSSLQRAVEQWAGTLEGDPADGEQVEQTWAWHESDVHALVHRTGTLHAQVRASETEALAATDQAEVAHHRASHELLRVRALQDRRARGLAAEERRALLTRRAEEIEQARSAQDDAVRADRVHVAEAPLTRARASLTRHQAALDRALAEIPADLRSRLEEPSGTGIHDHDASVDDLERSLALARGAQDRGTSLLADARAAAQHVTEAEDALQALGQQRAALISATEQGRTATARLAEVQEALAAYEASIVSRARLDLLTTDLLPAAQERSRTLQEAALDARERYLALLQRRLDGMAAELAEQLLPGQECPVCGSEQHPRTATSDGPVPAGTLEDADEEQRRAQEEHTRSAEDLRTLRAEADRLSAELAPEVRDLPALEQAAVELGVERDDLAGRVRDADAARAALPELDDRLDAARAEAAEARSAAAAATALSESVEHERDDHLAALRDLLAAHDDCPCEPAAAAVPAAQTRAGHLDDHGEELCSSADRVVAQHRHVAHLEDGVVRARRLLGGAEEAVATASADLHAAATEHGFADVADARAARLDQDQQRALRARIREHDEGLAAARHVLADPAVADALRSEEPDVAAAEHAEAAARGEVRRASSHHSTVQQVARAVRQCHDELQEIGQAQQGQAPRLDVVTRLADLVSGRGVDNVDGVSLTTYVLATRLERIAALANERLTQMADGRYELLVDHGRQDRRRRGGLGLDVLDRWTGETRPATSLSGGETFMVSLALALGTADGVREESGGRDVQSLFIDEGFGSLDDDALEQVMVVLDELRAGGRAVGVISHVADMRSRIPTQVRVERTTTGSHVQVLGRAHHAA